MFLNLRDPRARIIAMCIVKRKNPEGTRRVAPRIKICIGSVSSRARQPPHSKKQKRKYFAITHAVNNHPISSTWAHPVDLNERKKIKSGNTTYHADDHFSITPNTC